MKLCLECRHHVQRDKIDGMRRRRVTEHFCRAMEGQQDPVNGGTVGLMDCSAMRLSSDACGLDAKRFEAKA